MRITQQNPILWLLLLLTAWACLAAPHVGQKTASGKFYGLETASWELTSREAAPRLGFGGLAGESVSASLVGANSAGASTLAINQAVGAQAEADAAANFLNQGVGVSPRVSLTNGTVRAVGDIGLNGTPGATVQIPSGFAAEDLAGNPLLDVNGKPITSFQLSSQGQVVVEVKTGGATLSPNQATVYPVVQSGGATGVGANATQAGMGGSLQQTPVIVIRR